MLMLSRRNVGDILSDFENSFCPVSPKAWKGPSAYKLEMQSLLHIRVGGCQWSLNKPERPRCSFNRCRAMEGDFQKGNPVLLPHLGLYSKLHSLPTIPLPSLLFNSLSSTLALSLSHSPLILLSFFFLSTFLSSLLHFSFPSCCPLFSSHPLLSFSLLPQSTALKHRIFLKPMLLTLWHEKPSGLC